VSDSIKSRFPELLQLRLPRGTNTVLDELASREHRSKSEVVRQAILREVSSKGLELDAHAALEVAS
jgi:predicted transcriptional regulator